MRIKNARIARIVALEEMNTAQALLIKTAQAWQRTKITDGQLSDVIAAYNAKVRLYDRAVAKEQGWRE